MMITKFRAKFCEFSKVEEGLILSFIDEAKLEISPKIWGKYYENAVIYLAAHLLSMQGVLNQENQSQIREVTSKSVGALSISYASAKTGFEGLSGSYYLTKYGKRFLELKRLINPHFGVVR